MNASALDRLLPPSIGNAVRNPRLPLLDGLAGGLDVFATRCRELQESDRVEAAWHPVFAQLGERGTDLWQRLQPSLPRLAQATLPTLTELEVLAACLRQALVELERTQLRGGDRTALWFAATSASTALHALELGLARLR